MPLFKYDSNLFLKIPIDLDMRNPSGNEFHNSGAKQEKDFENKTVFLAGKTKRSFPLVSWTCSKCTSLLNK